MFDWFKSLLAKPANPAKAPAFEPIRPEANPGQRSIVRIALSGAVEREERLDLIAILGDVLTRHGMAHVARDGWLVLGDGLALRPEFLDLQPRDDGSAVRTSTTISAWHARHIPAGLFEFQHSIGATVALSVAEGFDQWLQLDLKTLTEALKAKDVDCMCMDMDMHFPGSADVRPFQRRVVLGPTLHMAQTEPSATTPAEAQADAPACDDHPFCPCCLFNGSFAAFKPQIEGEGFFGLRLFASRDADGEVEADCRINGVDWPAGAEALADYVPHLAHARV